MEVILLERVAKLGQMGDVVRVKDGFARNFLLPKGKALRATKDNRSRFETHEGRARGAQSRAEGRSGKGRPEARRPELHGAAPGGGKRPALRLGLAARYRHAGDRDRASRSTAIRSRSTRRSRPSACTRCRSSLHPEVEVTINVAVARSADEAERLARGEDVTVARDEANKKPRPRRWPRPKRSSSRRRSSQRRRGRRGSAPTTTPK